MISSGSFPIVAFGTIILFFAFISPVTALNCSLIPSYGSFKPWPKYILSLPDGPANSNMACWYYADCAFSQIQDTRKQQYAATSLVMGLIPLILKDVAWPHRRIAYIPRPQPWYIEIFVRALGLNPVIKKERIEYGKVLEKHLSRLVFVALLFALISTYGALTAIEIFSKRSALGCPFPIFIVAWFIVAIIPSCIEVAASRYRRQDERPKSPRENEEISFVDNTKACEFGVTAPEGIQGSQENLFVQFSWAIYYTAGTLVYSSIMLVSVLELLVWFTATCAATAASKMFAYKLCGYWGFGFK